MNIEVNLLKFNPIANKLIEQHFNLCLLCVVYHYRFLFLIKKKNHIVLDNIVRILVTFINTYAMRVIIIAHY